MPELPPVDEEYKLGYLLTSISVILITASFGFLGYQTLIDSSPAVEGDGVDREIEMIADDWHFEPETIEVQEGDEVRLIIESRNSETGEYDHGIAIPELGVNEELPAGETTVVEFVADEVGEFRFYCNVFCGQGHHDMSGEIVVTENEEQDRDHSHHDHESSSETQEVDVDEISLHPSEMPDNPDYQLYANGSYENYEPRQQGESRNVEVHTTFEEVNAEVVPGTTKEYWTFDGTVPGPMIRVREGDTIEWNLHNPEENDHPHNIAIHGASGPGGGGIYSDVSPDGTAKIDTEMLDPGVYIYHCAFPNVAEHIGYGMNGVIVVEPEEGLPEVDHEYYVLQMDHYTEAGGNQEAADLEDEGHLEFSREYMYKEEPTFVTFNGRPEAFTGERALGNYNSEIEPGEDVRVFFGNGGPALISSYRAAVGDKKDHYGGDFELIERNEETVVVPAGAAKMFEMSFDVPGNYNMYDHSFPRPYKGAWGEWQVSGNMEEYEDIFNPKEYDDLR